MDLFIINKQAEVSACVDSRLGVQLDLLSRVASPVLACLYIGHPSQLAAVTTTSPDTPNFPGPSAPQNPITRLEEQHGAADLEAT